MTFTKDEVYKVCKQIAPAFGFEPKLLYAFCLQEGGKDQSGNFDPSVARLEQGFYRRYTEPMTYATTTEVLLSASYGILQMMGESLREVGYFEWYYQQQLPRLQSFLGNPLSEIAVAKAINFYCDHLEVMVTWGARWLKKKFQLAKGDLKLTCQYWNGDKTGKYYKEVMEKYNSVK